MGPFTNYFIPIRGGGGFSNYDGGGGGLAVDDIILKQACLQDFPIYSLVL